MRAVKTPPISHPSPNRPMEEMFGTVYVPPKLKFKRTSVSHGPCVSWGLYGFSVCNGMAAWPPLLVELLSMQLDQVKLYWVLMLCQFR